MLNLFKKKPVIDCFARTWILETFEWALKNSDPDIFYNDVELIIPSSQSFPEEHSSKKDLVHYTFNTMKKYAGMENWNIKILEKPENSNPIVADTIVMSGVPYESPIDTSFPENDSDPIVINYSMELVENRERLVSSFACELSRIFSAYIEDEPPGGEEFYGHNVDLSSVFLGFGVIVANSAFQFEQYTNVGSQGWSTSSVGHLSQYELTYALAVFCNLKSISNEIVCNNLKSSLTSYFKLASSELSKDPKILWRLKNIKLRGK